MLSSVFHTAATKSGDACTKKLSISSFFFEIPFVIKAVLWGILLIRLEVFNPLKYIGVEKREHLSFPNFSLSLHIFSVTSLVFF